MKDKHENKRAGKTVCGEERGGCMESDAGEENFSPWVMERERGGEGALFFSLILPSEYASKGRRMLGGEGREGRHYFSPYSTY